MLTENYLMLIERRPTENELRDFTVTPEQWAAALRYYQEHKNELIQAAAVFREKAVSHREPPFLVGAAAMVIEPNLPAGEYAIYEGYNFTPAPGTRQGREKRCAERNALEAAEMHAKLIVSITTISKEIHTGDPTQAHDALHPCKECRLMFRSFKKGFTAGRQHHLQRQ